MQHKATNKFYFPRNAANLAKLGHYIFLGVLGVPFGYYKLCVRFFKNFVKITKFL